MSKVDTDQGLGPGSEPRRQELLGLNDDGTPKETAAPSPGRADTMDRLLDGFGPARPDRPRILPEKDATLPPREQGRRDLTPTSPGRRRQLRTVVLATLATFLVVTGVGVAVVVANRPSPPKPIAVTAVPVTVLPPVASTQEAVQTEPAVPTASAPAASASPARTSSARTAPPPSNAAVTAPATTTTTTTTASASVTTAKTATSAPPGMSLLPDDPHR